jgi:beta-lactamase family protein
VLVVGAIAPVPGMAARAAGEEPRREAASHARRGEALITTAAIRRARRFARSREGAVAFAVVDPVHRPRGLCRTMRFPSASVSKAMLLVAVLRRAAAKPLGETLRRQLRAMITVSDNDAASAVYARVGGGGLQSVAHVAGMNNFGEVGHWAAARITAADQARLFLRIDMLVPPAHRRYARKLLSSIVPTQRWGIAPVARRKGIKIFFKGGWRNGITHQVALLERGGRRVALAVLTSGSPSMGYRVETIERIAARVLP